MSQSPIHDRRPDSPEDGEQLLPLDELEGPLADVLRQHFPDNAALTITPDGPRRVFIQEVKI